MELLRLEKTLCDKPQVHNRQKIMKQAAKVTETVDRYVEGYSMLLSDLLIFATFHHALVSILQQLSVEQVIDLKFVESVEM